MTALNKSSSGLSKKTDSLLKSMIKDSKLTPQQAKQLMAKIKNNEPLPARIDPTSSKPSCDAPMAITRAPTKRSTGGGVRSKDMIDKLNPCSRDRFKPKPVGPSRDSQLSKLADVMYLGLEEANKAQVIKQGNFSKKDVLEANDEPVDEFEQVVAEIAEREQYMNQMAQLGACDLTVKAQCQAEISQRVRHLEKLDQQRDSELEERQKKLSISTKAHVL